ncbi:hypothetical protein PISMIDRAFT_689802 [Pisolithus microcarpus 441]|uniref:Uncharacterized protein n=1 Tax=Pisolithus microcarpus 441 TaxID=765257 RepID=A0A0C9YE22_9AGAM|nr:hypothetical protein PISMIDRAFT_689802 [Pisolithus microcarpus 441]
MCSQQLCMFNVSNAGIQVCLPVVLLPDSPSHSRAILACTYGPSLIPIDLVSTRSSFDRIPDIHTIPKTCPEFKTLCLAHHQDVNGKCRKFILDDNYASYYGFTRCATYPEILRRWLNRTNTGSIASAGNSPKNPFLSSILEPSEDRKMLPFSTGGGGTNLVC